MSWARTAPAAPAYAGPTAPAVPRQHVPAQAQPGIGARLWRRARWYRTTPPSKKPSPARLVFVWFLAWWVIGLVLKAIVWRIGAVLLFVGWEATKGKWRPMFAPAYLAAVAAAPVPHPVAVWLAASLTVAAYSTASIALGAALPARKDRPRVLRALTPRRMVISTLSG